MTDRYYIIGSQLFFPKMDSKHCVMTASFVWSPKGSMFNTRTYIGVKDNFGFIFNNSAILQYKLMVCIAMLLYFELK